MLKMSFLFNFDLPDEDCENSTLHNSDKKNDFVHVNVSHVENQNLETATKCVEPLPAKEVTDFCSDRIISQLDMKTMEFGSICLKVVDTSNMEQKLLDNPEMSSIVHSSSPLHSAVSSHSDLVAGVYEGGLKIWESGVDLVEFLSTHPLGAAVNLKGKIVLELGCGAGLPGLYCCKYGARQVDFQDYNEEVLKLLTHTNVISNQAEPDGLSSQVRYFSGDWSSFCQLAVEQKCKYDVILTAETIYNTENYSKLHDVFKTTLAEDGIVFLAAKTYYFGVGGSVDSFIEYVGSQNSFSVDVLHSVGRGVQRKILCLRHLIDHSSNRVKTGR